MKHMVLATVILLIAVVSFGIAYAVISIPLEYTTDILDDTYTDIATDMGWTDAGEVKNLLVSLVYIFAGCVVFAIFLFFVWYFAYAQKYEYERYQK